MEFLSCSVDYGCCDSHRSVFKHNCTFVIIPAMASLSGLELVCIAEFLRRAAHPCHPHIKSLTLKFLHRDFNATAHTKINKKSLYLKFLKLVLDLGLFLPVCDFAQFCG